MTSSQPSERLRVFFADDHPIVLDGIKALIAEDEQLDLVGYALDGPTALRRAVELKPDVAVLDLSMPGMNGIDVAKKLIAACPTCRVLLLTVHEDAAYLRQALEIGAAGYLLKRTATEELNRGIHAVASGGVYLDPAIAGRAVGSAARQLPIRTGALTKIELSSREVEVAGLTAAGYSSKTIALRLNIGVKSVETYKTRYMHKLGFQSRVELIHYAIAQGWLGTP
ncbi:response regulator transcription factor [Tardiphaga sp. vice352]|uniref:response regulator transcription factor n=1 Tax=unclassified Tardiphaga TaxID=2631404 RepID=UPI00116434C8|nr:MULTISPECIES: response regulator transcription factor [unclassified Tardiphaga]MBC7583759.1 response regulator transcription factor [Tardiphaga sp.]QDM15973.1 response regulator transcription factor [Tardiphaga sp. vice278]QDM21073.1 response regulator transcription factor [Tardiphaga sp. vice154]QDM26170.1 response regulator transcription factor [Tardiphaga sp. vice304]QDM31316.1 response regulator transcription factor [Tardiphaga sp. vice352]